MSKVDIPPKSNDPSEPVEWNQQAQDLFVATIRDPRNLLADAAEPDNLEEKIDLAVETTGQSPAGTQKTLQQGALDRVFNWWKTANNTERTIAVVGGAAVLALGAYLIKKAIDGVVRLGSWVVQKLTGYRNETIENIVKVGLGIGVAKAFYDVATSEEVVEAFVRDGWKGVGELLLTKIIENTINLENIGKERWDQIRERIPQLPEFGEVQDLINARGDALETAREAMDRMREKLDEEGAETGKRLWDRVLEVAPIAGGLGNNDNRQESAPEEEPPESENQPQGDVDADETTESGQEYDKEKYISVRDFKEEFKTQMVEAMQDTARKAENNPEITAGIIVYTPLDTMAIRTGNGALNALRWLVPPNLMQASTRIGGLIAFYTLLDQMDNKYDDELIPKESEAYREWVNTHEMFADNDILRESMLANEDTFLSIINGELSLYEVMEGTLQSAGHSFSSLLGLALEAMNPEGEVEVIRANKKGLRNLRRVLGIVRTEKYQEHKEDFEKVQELIEGIEDGMTIEEMHVTEEDIAAITEAVNNLDNLEGVQLSIEFEMQDSGIMGYTLRAPETDHFKDYQANLSIDSALDESDAAVVADFFHPERNIGAWTTILLDNALEATLEQIDAARKLDVPVFIINEVAYIFEGEKAIVVGGLDFLQSLVTDEDFAVEEYVAPYAKGLAAVTIFRTVSQLATLQPLRALNVPMNLVRSTIYPLEVLLVIRRLKERALKIRYQLQGRMNQFRIFNNVARNQAKLQLALAELYESQCSTLLRKTPVLSDIIVQRRLNRIEHLLRGVLPRAEAQKIIDDLGARNFEFKYVRDKIIPMIKERLKALGAEVDEVLDEGVDRVRPGTAASGVDETLERAAAESVDESPRPGARQIISESLDEGAESVKRQLPKIQEALEGMKIGDEKVASIMSELNKPHWLKAIAGFGEILGHNAVPVFVAYMAYDMRFGDTAHDPQGTVATHLGFIAAFKLGAEGLRRGGSVKQKLLLGLAGVATPLLAAFGVQIESVEDWVNDTLIAGDFSKAFWNQSEDALGVAEFYIANRLFFTGAVGRALGSKVDALAVRPLMGLALRSKIVSSIRNIFIKEGVKKLATKMGIVLATRGASATAVNAIPVAGQVASVALWLWTAWEVGNIGHMYYKAKKTEDLFESQEAKDVKNVTVDETGERSLHDEFEVFKQGTPFESYEYATLPPDIKMNFMLERYQELPDVHITIQRTDGSSETSHWTSGTVRYVKIVADGETTELTEEDLNTEAPETLPPADYVPVDIPYADLEAASEAGGEALITDYYNLEISTLRQRTEWSKLNPTVVDSKKITIQRTGMDFDSIVMEREGSTWKITSEKKDFEFAGNYSFHNALAYAGLVLHSIGFLYDEVHVKKHRRWKSEDGTLNPFYLNGDKEIVYSKDEYIFDVDRAVYGRDWMDFYVNNLKLRRESMVSGLNQYFGLHAADLDLIGD